MDEDWIYCSKDTCCLPTAERLFNNFFGEENDYCIASANTTMSLDDPDKEVVDTLLGVWHSTCAIIWLTYCFAIGSMVSLMWLKTARTDSFLRLSVEFIVAGPLLIAGVSVSSDMVQVFVLLTTLALKFVSWKTQCESKAINWREFDVGNRPPSMSVVRGLINYLTALCILAVDFEAFPKEFRKTRYYGAGLMDVGIGLFALKMGISSRRPSKKDFRRVWVTVVVLLVLGALRTVSIMAIDYRQDEHEYGKHLNAFFTLGFIKLFGTLVSLLARNDKQLLPLGLVVLFLHEIALNMGISDFVMSKDLERDSVLVANREGICSLPGFVGLYLIAQFYARWIRTQEKANYKDFAQKIKIMIGISGALWVFVAYAVLLLGLARVTCNLAYVAWIMALYITMTWLIMLLYDFLLSTIWPDETLARIEKPSLEADGAEAGIAQRSKFGCNRHCLPVLLKAVDYNGLVYFLLSNVLTGGVNIFLDPGDRSDLEGFFILLGYMAIANSVSYILYKYKIRIA